MATKIMETDEPTFPNLGVSLSLLRNIRDSEEMKKPMIELVHPEISKNDLISYSLERLRELAKELRVYSSLDGSEEFPKYDDATISREKWLQLICSCPKTTTHVNLCLIKPATKDLNGSYATTVLAGQTEYVGPPTDFASHAWRYDFAHFVNALEAEATERDTNRLAQHLEPISMQRYYWNDIFVEDQNATTNKPQSYWFNAFRQAVISIGRTILVLEPLEAAIPMTRAWCVYEMFCSIASPKCELAIALAPSERVKFEAWIVKDFKRLIKIVSNVDAANSVAFMKSDQDKIHSIIRDTCPGGFDGVNKVICAGLREWLLFQGNRALQEQDLQCQNPEILTRHFQLMTRVGQLETLLGKRTEAEKHLSLALNGLVDTAGKDDEITLLATSNLATLLQKCGRYSEAQKLFENIIKLRQDQLKIDMHIENEDSMDRMIKNLRSKVNNLDINGDNNATKTLNVLLSQVQNYIISISNLALLYQKMGEFNKAEQLLKKCVGMMENLFGLQNINTIDMVANLASIMQDLKQLEEAEVLYRRVLEAKQQLLGISHPSTITTLNNLASCLFNQCKSSNNIKFLEALTLFEEALVSLRKVFGPQHPNTISCIGNLGWMYKSQNKFNKALPLLTRAVDLKTKSLGLNHPDTLTSIFTLASLFMQTKEYLEAEKLSRQVLDGRLATEGGKQYVRESVDQLGMILLLQGKSRDAKAMEKSQGFKRDKNTLELEVYNGKKERCVVS